MTSTESNRIGQHLCLNGATAGVRRTSCTRMLVAFPQRPKLVKGYLIAQVTGTSQPVTSYVVIKCQQTAVV